MSNGMILLVAFVCVSLAIFCAGQLVGDWVFSYRKSVRSRLSGMLESEIDEQTISLFKNTKSLRDELHQKSTWRDALQELVDQSGTGYSPEMIVLWCVLAAIGVGGVIGLRSWMLGAAIAPAGAFIPIVVLIFFRNRRCNQLSKQLPEAFEMMSRAVKAGQTVPAAMQIIATEFQAPISSEFALCYEQQNLGVSRESALRQLAARSGILELRMFVVALNMQARSGGNLTELLENLANLIRKRMKMRARVKALTGEGRMQASVLFVLPFAAFLGIYFLAPDYAQTLLERPWVLVATLGAQIVGSYWIQRIIRVNY
ncbi:type II secretion system F family protein [Blastopirellula marina]|uniref:Type II secretion system protein n=1 Tax=Blastopirellula marina TaxID=124 RepID=A0A2S8G244_9BACT|nr:type II secretion system F family protein [Blastopirellula marina]PQO38519.1 type II secretion system protein [Blastopirellula marina]PTL45176.1 type II secretion system protein [Blastopirellula marina]